MDICTAAAENAYVQTMKPVQLCTLISCDCSYEKELSHKLKEKYFIKHVVNSDFHRIVENNRNFGGKFGRHFELKKSAFTQKMPWSPTLCTHSNNLLL